MARQLLTEPEADQELADAVRWYQEQRTGLGRRFLDAVATTVERVQRFPHAGSAVPYLSSAVPARWAPVKGFPYHVVYLITPEAIRILAFAHYRRRPGYWEGRSGS